MPTSSPVKEVTAGNYVLYVSTVERRKNHEIVYRAFRRLAERYSPAALPRLLFVGAQGWGVGDLLNEIASDPIVRGLIIQLNQVSDSELRWLYENALFFVFPSLYEGWGLPVAEALTAGKPVIASNCGPLPEIGGDLVEYVDPWDLLGWVSAIERLWLDHGWRQRLSDHIARDYRPSGWSGAAADIARIATGLDGQPVHPFSAVRTTRPEEIVISAVICTHNRVDYLQKALGSLLQQTLPASTYEILIVDNGSDDATRDVVLNMMRSVNNLRYFFEPLLGLSRARNRGISEARGAFIAFLDDDAIADADWLEWGVRVHKEHPGGLGFVGGEVRPIWESRRPAWLSDDLLPYLSLAKVGNYATYVDGDSGLVGANMMFRVNDLIECGGFSVLLGRKGECLLSNEELVLKRALQERGLRSLYHPRVAVSHHVIPSRLTKSWFRSRFYWQGRSDALLASASADTSNARYLLEILRLFRSFARGLGHWVWLSAFKTSEEATFLAQCRVFAAWGHLHGVFLRYVR
jgi:glycosyltransferase involved in cell wall biosynthesis